GAGEATAESRWHTRPCSLGGPAQVPRHNHQGARIDHAEQPSAGGHGQSHHAQFQGAIRSEHSATDSVRQDPHHECFLNSELHSYDDPACCKQDSHGVEGGHNTGSSEQEPIEQKRPADESSGALLLGYPRSRPSREQHADKQAYTARCIQCRDAPVAVITGPSDEDVSAYAIVKQVDHSTACRPTDVYQ